MITQITKPELKEVIQENLPTPPPIKRLKKVTCTWEGCGKVINVSVWANSKTIYCLKHKKLNTFLYHKAYRNEHPEYHQDKKIPKKELFLHNGCVIVPAREGRCRDFITCPEYLICLNQVGETHYGGFRGVRV
jgi:hypothetical protein